MSNTLVLIPALNESGALPHTIGIWQRMGPKRIRVVDNGSIDLTAQSAAAVGAEVIHEPRRGYGAAVWGGLQNWPEDCDWVLFSSADGSDQLDQHEIGEWQRAVDSGADLVIGDRITLPASRRHLKPSQRLGNWVCVTAIALGWGRRFRDMGSLRLVRRDALERMQLQDRGFGWNVEMQVRALELGLKIAELPVVYYPRASGESKISGSITGTFCAGHGILRMLFHLYRLKRAHQRAVATASAVAA